MRQVFARRDDNWKKLQQYVLDEREQIEVRGPSRQPIWGERREYTWYIRDGFFVRSPVKINGVEIGEADRRKYEAEFLERTKARDARAQKAAAEAGAAGRQPTVRSRKDPILSSAAPEWTDCFVRSGNRSSSRRPTSSVSSSRKAGTRSSAARRSTAGRRCASSTIRPISIPTVSSAAWRATTIRNDPQDAEIMRMMNKVALVTLWIEPESNQIVKYTFDNIDFDFLPAQWFVRLESVRATMTMSQPFADVWLPKNLEFLVAAELASGRYDVRGTVDYDDYRQADVKTKVDVGSGR